MTRSRWGWRRSTAIGAITVLAVGALASFAAAVSSSGTPAAVSQYEKKVTICHHTHSKKHPFVTITVSRNALPAHLRHGDTVGPCAADATAKKAAVLAKSGHAKKNEKGSPSAETSSKDGGSAPLKASSSPGNSGSTPGHSGSSPGRSGNAPGHSSTTPGQSGTAPGKSETAPGKSETAPGKSGTAPGHGGTPPGHSGSAPGQSGTAPGHGGTPPGHGGTPPGQGKK
jgi:hypothetical protein